MDLFCQETNQKNLKLNAVGTVLRYALINASGCNYWLWLDLKTSKSEGSRIIASGWSLQNLKQNSNTTVVGIILKFASSEGCHCDNWQLYFQKIFLGCLLKDQEVKLREEKLGGLIRKHYKDQFALIPC